MNIETLEGRVLLSITAVVRYTYDANNFFDTQAKRDLLEKALQAIVHRLGDNLDEISSSGNNTWTASFPNPATGSTQQIPNLVVKANRLIFYAGGRELGSTLGLGGSGAFAASGSSDFLQAVRTRGESGVDNNTDFAPWGGAITFDTTTNWHFGQTTDGLENDEADFYSVALHEFMHALGFGGADSWDAQIVGGKFAGPKSVAAYDGSGNVPLNGGRDHWAEGTTDGGDEVAMDPTLLMGTRKLLTDLDFAGLDDIGWDILPSVSIEATDAVAREQSSNRGVFRVTRRTDDLSEPLRVRYNIKGTATNGADYNEIAASVRIAAGKTFANVVIRPIDDASNEGTEQVKLYLRGSTAYGISPDADRARVNIRDNDSSSLRPSAASSSAFAIASKLNSLAFSTAKFGDAGDSDDLHPDDRDLLADVL